MAYVQATFIFLKFASLGAIKQLGEKTHSTVHVVVNRATTRNDGIITTQFLLKRPILEGGQHGFEKHQKR